MAESQPLSDKQIDELGTQGFVEGDLVPGKGILTPLGTFRTPDTSAGGSTAGGGTTGSSKSTTTTTTKTGGAGTTDPFLEQLQNRLLGQSDIISSGQTGLESKIQEAIGGIKTGQEASAAKLESEAGRAIGGIKEAGAQKLTSAREAQRGFGVNNAALKQITDDTQKSVRDLDQRKQELILSGEAKAAGQITDLQIKAIEFQQQAQQQTFSNLLQVGGFAIEKSREQRLQAQQTNQEKQQIASIALEFGLPVTEGETMDTILAKASPLATEQQRLKLEKTRAEIQRINAETQKALAGQNFAFDPLMASTLAQAFRQGQTGFLAGLESNEQFSGVFEEVMTQETADRQATGDLANQIKQSGGSMNDFITAIQQDQNIIIDEATANMIGASVFTQEQGGGGLFEGLINFTTSSTKTQRSLRSDLQAAEKRLKNARNTNVRKQAQAEVNRLSSELGQTFN